MKMIPTDFAQIFNICWAELMRHKQAPDEELWANEEHRILRYAGGGTDSKVTEEEARYVLSAWLQWSIDKYGAIYLYTCGDNGEIGISDDPEEEIGYWEEDERKPGGIKIFWGFD
jgi:hypothetical protein